MRQMLEWHMDRQSYVIIVGGGAVMDAVGIERAVLIGWVDTAALALVVATSHPERVRSLVLGELMAVTRPDEMFPWGADPELLKAVARSIESGGWGQALLLPQIAPSAASTASGSASQTVSRASGR